MMNYATKQNVARRIERFFKENDSLTDTRIYFGKSCWDYDSAGNKTVMKDMKATDYIQYANNKTVTVSTEGPMYGYLNAYRPGWVEVNEELRSVIEEATNGEFYMEMGNAWNFTLWGA